MAWWPPQCVPVQCVPVVCCPQQFQNPCQGFSLYHYTSEDGCRGILQQCQIRPSTNTEVDATMGIGVYLTPIPPWSSDKEIVFNNWDGGRTNFYNQLSKIDYYIEFNSAHLPGIRKNPWGRQEWLYPGIIDLRQVPHKVCFRGHHNMQVAQRCGFC